MSREPLVFLSAEPPSSESNVQEDDCADGTCAIPSRPDGEPGAIRDAREG